MLGVGVAVVTQGHIDVLKGADADELALAAAVAGLALFAQTVFVVDVHKLLRRGGHEDHVAVEGLFDLGHAQGQGRADGGGQLGVVAAAVGGAGLGVGVLVVGDGQGVQLTDDGHGGAGGALGLQVALGAGDGQTLVHLHPQVFEQLVELAGGTELPVPQLGVMPNIPAKGHDLLAVLVDGFDDLLLDLIQ